MNTVDADTGRRRLLLLVEKLRSVPDERFNYAHWVGADWGGARDLSCGTSACALGWATAVPEIAAAGLRLRSGANGGYVSLEDEDLLDGSTGAFSAPTVAAQIVFGLSRQEADYLFMPGEPPPRWIDDDEANCSPDEFASVGDVACHIERFVALKWPVSP